MSQTYKHTLLSELGQNFTLDYINMAPSISQSYRESVLLDGIPVNVKLQEFGLALRNKFPAVKFHATGNGGNKTGYVASSSGGQLHVFTDVYVYVDSCPYTLGRIGHGKKYGVQQLDEPVFMVDSRKIQNNKYAEWREESFRVFSKDLSKAVKQARANLLPYTIPEIADISFSQFKNDINNDGYRATNNLKDKLKPIMYDERIAEEMAHMFAAGLTFHSQEMKAMMADVAQLYNTMINKRSDKRPATFVAMRTVGDAQWFDIIEVPTAKNGGIPHNTPVQSYLFGNLPADIQESLAVLTTCNHGQFIPDVGRRVSDTTFWVEK